MAGSTTILSNVRWPLGGKTDGGSFDDGSPSVKSYFLALVFNSTVDLTIMKFAVEDSALPWGGGAITCVIICCCWGGGLVNTISFEGDPPNSRY
jgi:hypothetical protein